MKHWTGVGHVFFGRSNNCGAIDVKMDGFVLDKKSSFKMLVLSFSFSFTLSLLLKLPEIKFEI